MHSTSLSKEIKSSVDLEKALNKAEKKKTPGKVVVVVCIVTTT